MKKEYGFFVRYDDGFYSKSYETLKEAKKESHDTYGTLCHGYLQRINDEIFDDSDLYEVKLKSET